MPRCFDLNHEMTRCNISSEELFYQILLYDFENFEQITFEPPLSIQELAKLALQSEESGWTPEDGPIEELADRIQDILVEKSCILREYFGLNISDDGFIQSLPYLLGEFTAARSPT